MIDTDSPDYNDTNLGDPRETPDERRIRELEAEILLLRPFKLQYDTLRDELADARRELERTKELWLLDTKRKGELLDYAENQLAAVTREKDLLKTAKESNWADVQLAIEQGKEAFKELEATRSQLTTLQAKLAELERDKGPMTTVAREGFAEQAFQRDLEAKRENHHVICVEKLRVPNGAELMECYRIGNRIVVMGEPDQTEDENHPAYHNCDAMGCGCLGHVIALLDIPSSDAARQPQP